MPNLTAPQLALLRHMADRGLSVIGILGADALHPNQRIYYTSDGELVYQKIPGRGYRIVNSLETRGLIKVISTSGEDPPRLKHLVATAKGRAILEQAPATGWKLPGGNGTKENDSMMRPQSIKPLPCDEVS